MPYINQYIELCQEHPHIFLGAEEYQPYAKNWDTYFGNSHPLVLEIGTGMGNYFSYMVQYHPEKNFLGLELRYKRLYSSARKCNESNNFVIIQEYGEKIGELVGEETLSETYIYFPDPWANKDKQKKKRLLQADFLQTLFRLTQPGGMLYFKTDHRSYFEDTLEILADLGLWTQEYISYDYKNSEMYRSETITEFEGLFRGEQEDFYYLILSKK